MANMKFRAHETFFIRKGWLSKGMKAIVDDPYVFMGVDGRNPMDDLGLGANMVKSLRYWMQATRIAEEPNFGKRYQTLTDDFGKPVFENDPYLEEMGTLWAIHCNLACNKELATSWYFFFNEFAMKSFNRDDLTGSLERFIRMNTFESVSAKSLQDDYNCILGTYISRERMQGKAVSPENNIDCPLGELGILDVDNRGKKTFKKKQASLSDLDALLVLYAILKQLSYRSADESNEISLDDLLNGVRSPGKLFNLDSVSLLTLLYELEDGGYLRVIRTAGMDSVRIGDKVLTPEGCLAEYYELIG